jgi:hypothetical protein
MPELNADIEDLLRPQSKELRIDLSEQFLCDRTESFLSSSKTLVEQELQTITLQARKYADAFWDANEAAREEGDPSSVCYIGTRIRVKQGTLQLEWFKNRTRPDRGASKPKQVFSTYLKKGKGFRYSDQTFNKEPQWAQEEIQITEDTYALLRRRAALLTILKKTLRDYSALADECYPNAIKAVKFDINESLSESP